MKLYEAGFAGTTVPTKYGGHGGEAWMQKIFREESTGYQVQTGFYHSIIAMALPALNTEPNIKTRTHQDANKW